MRWKQSESVNTPMICRRLYQKGHSTYWNTDLSLNHNGLFNNISCGLSLQKETVLDQCCKCPLNYLSFCFYVCSIVGQSFFQLSIGLANWSICLLAPFVQQHKIRFHNSQYLFKILDPTQILLECYYMNTICNQ